MADDYDPANPTDDVATSEQLVTRKDVVRRLSLVMYSDHEDSPAVSSSCSDLEISKHRSSSHTAQRHNDHVHRSHGDHGGDVFSYTKRNGTGEVTNHGNSDAPGSVRKEHRLASENFPFKIARSSEPRDDERGNKQRRTSESKKSSKSVSTSESSDSSSDDSDSSSDCSSDSRNSKKRSVKHTGEKSFLLQGSDCRQRKSSQGGELCKDSSAQDKSVVDFTTCDRLVKGGDVTANSDVRICNANERHVSVPQCADNKNVTSSASDSAGASEKSSRMISSDCAYHQPSKTDASSSRRSRSRSKSRSQERKQRRRSGQRSPSSSRDKHCKRSGSKRRSSVCNSLRSRSQNRRKLKSRSRSRKRSVSRSLKKRSKSRSKSHSQGRRSSSRSRTRRKSKSRSHSKKRSKSPVQGRRRSKSRSRSRKRSTSQSRSRRSHSRDKDHRRQGDRSRRESSKERTRKEPDASKDRRPQETSSSSRSGRDVFDDRIRQRESSRDRSRRNRSRDRSWRERNALAETSNSAKSRREHSRERSFNELAKDKSRRSRSASRDRSSRDVSRKSPIKAIVREPQSPVSHRDQTAHSTVRTFEQLTNVESALVHMVELDSIPLPSSVCSNKHTVTDTTTRIVASTDVNCQPESMDIDSDVDSVEEMDVREIALPNPGMPASTGNSKAPLQLPPDLSKLRESADPVEPSPLANRKIAFSMKASNKVVNRLILKQIKSDEQVSTDSPQEINATAMSVVASAQRDTTVHLEQKTLKSESLVSVGDKRTNDVEHVSHKVDIDVSANSFEHSVELHKTTGSNMASKVQASSDIASKVQTSSDIASKVQISSRYEKVLETSEKSSEATDRDMKLESSNRSRRSRFTDSDEHSGREAEKSVSLETRKESCINSRWDRPTRKNTGSDIKATPDISLSNAAQTSVHGSSKSHSEHNVPLSVFNEKMGEHSKPEVTQEHLVDDGKSDTSLRREERSSKEERKSDDVDRLKAAVHETNEGKHTSNQHVPDNRGDCSSTDKEQSKRHKSNEKKDYDTECFNSVDKQDDYSERRESNEKRDDNTERRRSNDKRENDTADENRMQHRNNDKSKELKSEGRKKRTGDVEEERHHRTEDRHREHRERKSDGSIDSQCDGQEKKSEYRKELLVRHPESSRAVDNIRSESDDRVELRNSVAKYYEEDRRESRYDNADQRRSSDDSVSNRRSSKEGMEARQEHEERREHDIERRRSSGERRRSSGERRRSSGERRRSSGERRRSSGERRRSSGERRRSSGERRRSSGERRPSVISPIKYEHRSSDYVEVRHSRTRSSLDKSDEIFHDGNSLPLYRSAEQAAARSDEHRDTRDDRYSAHAEYVSSQRQSAAPAYRRDSRERSVGYDSCRGQDRHQRRSESREKSEERRLRQFSGSGEHWQKDASNRDYVARHQANLDSVSREYASNHQHADRGSLDRIGYSSRGEQHGLYDVEVHHAERDNYARTSDRSYLADEKLRLDNERVDLPHVDRDNFTTDHHNREKDRIDTSYDHQHSSRHLDLSDRDRANRDHYSRDYPDRNLISSDRGRHESIWSDDERLDRVLVEQRDHRDERVISERHFVDEDRSDQDLPGRIYSDRERVARDYSDRIQLDVDRAGREHSDRIDRDRSDADRTARERVESDYDRSVRDQLDSGRSKDRVDHRKMNEVCLERNRSDADLSRDHSDRNHSNRGRSRDRSKDRSDRNRYYSKERSDRNRSPVYLNADKSLSGGDVSRHRLDRDLSNREHSRERSEKRYRDSDRSYRNRADRNRSRERSRERFNRERSSERSDRRRERDRNRSVNRSKERLGDRRSRDRSDRSRSVDRSRERVNRRRSREHSNRDRSVNRLKERADRRRSRERSSRDRSRERLERDRCVDQSRDRLDRRRSRERLDRDQSDRDRSKDRVDRSRDRNQSREHSKERLDKNRSTRVLSDQNDRSKNDKSDRDYESSKLASSRIDSVTLRGPAEDKEKIVTATPLDKLNDEVKDRDIRKKKRRRDEEQPVDSVAGTQPYVSPEMYVQQLATLAAMQQGDSSQQQCANFQPYGQQLNPSDPATAQWLQVYGSQLCPPPPPGIGMPPWMPMPNGPVAPMPYGVPYGQPMPNMQAPLLHRPPMPPGHYDLRFAQYVGTPLPPMDHMHFAARPPHPDMSLYPPRLPDHSAASPGYRLLRPPSVYGNVRSERPLPKLPDTRSIDRLKPTSSDQVLSAFDSSKDVLLIDDKEPRRVDSDKLPVNSIASSDESLAKSASSSVLEADDISRKQRNVDSIGQSNITIKIEPAIASDGEDTRASGRCPTAAIKKEDQLSEASAAASEESALLDECFTMRRRSARLKHLDDRKDSTDDTKASEKKTPKKRGRKFSTGDGNEVPTRFSSASESDAASRHSPLPSSGIFDLESAGTTSLLSAANASELMLSPASVNRSDSTDKMDPGSASRPQKVKSRWLRWCESEVVSGGESDAPKGSMSERSVSESYDCLPVPSSKDSGRDSTLTTPPLSPTPVPPAPSAAAPAVKTPASKPAVFEHIVDNIYLHSRDFTRARKEGRRMVCDCVPPGPDERGVVGCGEDCLNRMLLIECGSRCPCGELCSNRQFQKRMYSKTEVFRTELKGNGLLASEDIDRGAFIMEYVGEVVDFEEFKCRTTKYARDGCPDFYFMALSADEIVDATVKGSTSRFINHSCDPNCETQKWTVNGSLRVGFFAVKNIKAGEELTFDYKFERYGETAQTCYCGASNCRGVIGGVKNYPARPQDARDSYDSRETKQRREKRRKDRFSDILLDDEIEQLSSLESGMRRKEHVLELSRLMVRAENSEHRLALLRVLQDTKESACLRLFLDYHGLRLIWSWMVDVPVGENCELQKQILTTLKMLPVADKGVLRDARVLSLVEKWAQCMPEKSGIPVVDSSASLASVTTVALQPADSTDVTSNNTMPDGGDGDKVGEIAEASGSCDDTAAGRVIEAMPLKKRRMLAAACHSGGGDDMSSSDSDVTENPVQSTCDSVPLIPSDGDLNVSVADLAAAGTDATSGADQQASDNSSLAELRGLAGDLLLAWKSLQEETYRIPKKVVEERKLMEQELTRRHSVELPPPPPPPQSHRKRQRASDDDEDAKSKAKRILLPTPPVMSKAERRQQFEAQVKAEDETKQRQQELEQQKSMLEQMETQAMLEYFSQSSALSNTPLQYGSASDSALAALQSVLPFGIPAVPSSLPAGGQQMFMPPPVDYLQQQQQQVLYVQTPTGYQMVTVPQSAVATCLPGQQQQTLYLPSTAQAQGTELMQEVPPPPPSPPPKSRHVRLPPNWKTAKDSDGQTYYYHTITRQTQWDAPSWGEHADSEIVDDMDLGTPTHNASKKEANKEKALAASLKSSSSGVSSAADDVITSATIAAALSTTTTAAADTSTETAKKLKDVFRSNMSLYVIHCLGAYQHAKCSKGRITNNEDFKYVARKLTHAILEKELKHCRNLEDLEVNSNVKSKAKNFIARYMNKFGSVFKRSSDSP